MEFSALPIVPGKSSATKGAIGEPSVTDGKALGAGFENKLSQVKTRSGDRTSADSTSSDPSKTRRVANEATTDKPSPRKPAEQAGSKERSSDTERAADSSDADSSVDNERAAEHANSPHDKDQPADEAVAQDGAATSDEELDDAERAARDGFASEVVFELAASRFGTKTGAGEEEDSEGELDMELDVGETEGSQGGEEELGDFTHLTSGEGEEGSMGPGAQGGEADFTGLGKDGAFGAGNVGAEQAMQSGAPGAEEVKATHATDALETVLEAHAEADKGQAGQGEGVDNATQAVAAAGEKISERGAERRDEGGRGVDPAQAQSARQRGDGLGAERSQEHSQQQAGRDTDTGWKLMTDRSRANARAEQAQTESAAFAKVMKAEGAQPTQATQPQQLDVIPGLQNEKSAFEASELKPAAVRTPLTPAPLGRQVGDAVRLAIMNRGDRAVIQLRPEALGRVQVNLIREADGITARIQVETAHAQQALTSEVEQLRESFASRGVNLLEVQVELQERRADEGGSWQNEGKKNNNGNRLEDEVELSELPDTELMTPHWQPWGFEVRA